MVVQIRQQMTVDAFDEWVKNLDGDYEYIAGETLPVVSNNYCSMVAAKILTFIGMYLLQHDIGYVTGSDGGYQVHGERYIPDVGFIRRSVQPEPCYESYNPNPPDLAVEVVSPTDKEKNLLVKLSNYLADNTTVWIVYPDEQEVHIHQAGKGATLIDINGTLTSELLPEFKVAVKDIFPAKKD